MITNCYCWIRKLSEAELDSLSDGGIPVKAIGGYSFSYQEGTPQAEIAETVVKQAQKNGATVIMNYINSFSDSEIEQARWLHLRSIFAGFECCNKKWPYHSECLRGDQVIDGKKIGVQHEHLIQVASFEAKRSPKWKKERQFCSNYSSAMTALFCSDQAKEMIEQNGLTGAQFSTVFHCNSTQVLDNLWQLTAVEVEDFLMPNQDVIVWECESCGRKRYSARNGKGAFGIQENNVPRGLDFFQSFPVVGADIGYPYLVISAKACRALKQAGITRGLVFEPMLSK